MGFLCSGRKSGPSLVAASRSNPARDVQPADAAVALQPILYPWFRRSNLILGEGLGLFDQDALFTLSVGGVKLLLEQIGAKLRGIGIRFSVIGCG